MSIDPELLADCRLVSPLKTSFRIRPPKKRRENRTPTFQERRHALYQKAWGRALEKISHMIEEVQGDLISDLETFLNTLSFKSVKWIRQPIPTAVILGSSSMLNASIGARIAELRGPTGAYECLPVQLSSRACFTLDATIKTIVDALELRLGLYNDEISKKQGHRSQYNLARDDVRNVLALHREHTHHYLSSFTAPNQQSHGPKLALFIDEFEGFDPVVLEDLIAILSGLLETIPIVLLLSLKTSADAIHSLLPRSTVVNLQLTPFAVDLNESIITSLLRHVALDSDGPFDLSDAIIRSLGDNHQRLNKTLDHLISQLQFLYLAYFYTNPLCEFFHSVQTGEPPSFPPTNVQHVALQLQLTPSWQRTRPKDMKSDEEMLHLLSSSFRRRQEVRSLTFQALDALDRLGSLWPEKGRSSDWILHNIYRPELVNYSQEICRLLRHGDDTTLLDALNLLPDLPNSEKLHTYRQKLIELMSDPQIKQTSGRSHLFNSHEPHAGIKLFDADKQFSQLVADVSEYLMEFFRNFLGSSSLLTLHEAWTFDDHVLLQEVFHPPYVDRLKSNLLNKGILSESTSHNEEVSNQSNLGRVYELYGNSNGKTINLADWFGAYESLKLSEEESHSRALGKRPRKSTRDGAHQKDGLEVEKMFLRAVGDLGFIGFVARCGRKKEHVNKNVW